MHRGLWAAAAIARGMSRSWGGWPETRQAVHDVWWTHLPLPLPLEGTVLPHGLGRSYGDVALNDGHTLLRTLGLDRYLDFDRERGTLTCEAGVSLGEVLDLVVPEGWFLPVVPGTRHVTVGGAIANDVHGKNHRAMGTFGRHVMRFELLRSDGTRRECSPAVERELFSATLGGLGLTGLVTWAQLQLVRIPSATMSWEDVPFRGVDEWIQLTDRGSDDEHEVAWIDGLARDARRARGVLQRGRFVASNEPPRPPRRRRLPARAPVNLVRRPVVSAFASWRLARQRRPTRHEGHFGRFLHPLDAIDGWNGLYGPRGFVQHQSVVPLEDGGEALCRLIETCAASSQTCALASLKRFGEKASPGLLSFPRRGATLALDLPMRGARTLALLRSLDAIVRDAGGAVYPAKDACMEPATFRASFPRWSQFQELVDPRFSSSFWRRVRA